VNIFSEYWGYIVGLGGVGGVLVSLRKLFPALLTFLSDAGTAPYLRTQNKALRILLDEKTDDYDELLKDYRILAKMRRAPEDLPD
jgi:hypothetical protein